MLQLCVCRLEAKPDALATCYTLCASLSGTFLCRNYADPKFDRPTA